MKGVIWKDINGLPGYQVSDSGHVRKTGSRKFLAENVNGSSSRYLRVTIGQKHYLVHRLVAMAFIPNPEGLPEVDHITLDKTDNSVSNLRWVDHSSNITLMWVSIHLGGKAVTPRHRNIQKEKETALSR